VQFELLSLLAHVGWGGINFDQDDPWALVIGFSTWLATPRSSDPVPDPTLVSAGPMTDQQRLNHLERPIDIRDALEFEINSTDDAAVDGWATRSRQGVFLGFLSRSAPRRGTCVCLVFSPVDAHRTC